MTKTEIEKKGSYNALSLVTTGYKYFPDWLNSEPVEASESFVNGTFDPPAAPVEEKAAAPIFPPAVKSRFTVSVKPDWHSVRRARERGYAARVVDVIAESWTELFWTRTESEANRLLADYKANAAALGFGKQEYRIERPSESRVAA